MLTCPVCGHTVDSDDYWYGDKCLRCALEGEDRKLPITREGCAIMLLANLVIWGIVVSIIKLLIK